MEYVFVSDSEKINDIYNELQTCSVIGFDIETTNKERSAGALDPRKGDIRVFSINMGTVIYVIDLFKAPLIDKLIDWFATTEAVICIQNAKFETKWFLYKYGIHFNNIFDTMRASYLLYNGLKKDNKPYVQHLWAIEERELQINHDSLKDLGNSNWGIPNLTEEQIKYSALDTTYLLELRRVLREKLKSMGLLATAKIEFDAIPAEASVELNGLCFEPKDWLKIAETNRTKARELKLELLQGLPNPSLQMNLFDLEAMEAPLLSIEEDDSVDEMIYKMSTQTYSSLVQHKKPKRKPSSKSKLFNTDSSAQVLEALHRLDIKDSNGLLIPDTNFMTLVQYKNQHPIIEKLIEYRGYSKAFSSFGPDFIKWVNPETNRIHPDYFGFLLSGRFAPRNPNLSQIPGDKQYRKCFKAPPGWVIVASDLSNVEMRIIADVSNDEVLLDTFNHPEAIHKADAHLVTAAFIQDTPLEEFLKQDEALIKKQRKESKCFHPNTEVLTKNGWKRINSLHAEEYIVQAIPIDKDTIHLEWVQPTEIFTKINEVDYLFEIKTRNSYIQVTPEHRVLCFDKINREYITLEAQELYTKSQTESIKRFRVPTTGTFIKPKYVKKSIIDLYFLYEYSFTVKNNESFSIIYDKTELNYVKSVLTANKVKFEEFVQIDSHSTNYWIVYIDKTETRKINRKTNNGVIPVTWVSCSTIQKRYIISKLFEMKAVSTKTHISIKKAESVDIIATILNSLFYTYDILHNTSENNYELHNVVKYKLENYNNSIDISKTPYNGVVSCLSVPSSYVLVRDGIHKKPFISGQSINFGLCYGMKPTKLILYALSNYDVVMSPSQAQRSYDKYFELYKGVKRWHDEEYRLVKKTGISRSLSGRLRYMDDDAFNEIYNNKIQATGADGLKRALRILFNLLKKYKGDAFIAHHVHDEIIVLCKDTPQMVESVKKDLSFAIKEGIQPLLKRVRIECETVSGFDWSCKS